MTDRHQTAGWMSVEFITKQVHPGKGVLLALHFLSSYLLSKAETAAPVGSSIPLTGWHFLG